MTLGKFIQLHYQGCPLFINTDHVIRVTELPSGKAALTLSNKETAFVTETYLEVVAQIENVTCYRVD